MIIIIILTFIYTVGLSPSRNICFISFNESPLQVMKNGFYFILKALFVLNIFKSLSWLFGLVRGFRCKKKSTLWTNWYFIDLFFGIERRQSDFRYRWCHKESERNFYKIQNKVYRKIFYYCTKKKKILQPYNNFECLKKYDPLKIRLWRHHLS